MWYKKMVIAGACVAGILVAYPEMVNHVVRVRGSIHKVMLQSRYVRLVSTAVAQESQADTSPPKKSGREAGEKKSEKSEHTTPTQPKKKSAPLKDFVPTEKIRTDNAVDFPADI